MENFDIREVRISRTMQGMGQTATIEAVAVLPHDATVEDAQNAARALADFVAIEAAELDPARC